MKIQCDYCGSFISDTDEKCPNCGAVNLHLMRSAEGIPKTIDALKVFCAGRNMPLEKMRFFLGEDHKGAKAFGIFEDDDGNFVVYKNKADGTRAVRYRGKDEAYAVNEIYQKLKGEVQQRKLQNVPVRSAAGTREKSTKPGCARTLAIALGLCLIIVLFISCVINTPDSGYYNYGGNNFYYDYSDGWFGYDDSTGQWSPASVDGELSGNYGDYWQSSYYSDSYGAGDFSESEYYSSSDSKWSSDWDDSDWDVDYDSWDSGDTDWDSDW